jgi:hypothetical protein
MNAVQPGAFDPIAGYEEAAVMEGEGRYAMDKNLHVEFFRRPVFNSGKSNEAGRPVYDEADFVMIYVSRNASHVQKVDNEIKNRFATRWARYQAGLDQAQTGTPLEQWPAMSVSMVANMKAMKIFTVEQLADLDDNRAQEFMGNFDLRKKAKAWLELARDSAANDKLEAQLKKRDDEIAEMRAMIAELQAKDKAIVESKKVKEA